MTYNTNFLNQSFQDLSKTAETYRQSYLSAKPFPHIVLDNFFDEQFLSGALAEFPDLSLSSSSVSFNSSSQVKFASHRGDSQQPDSIKHLLRYLNSHSFLDFLASLTSIEESLIPDPHFNGGGLHEIKTGGFLKVHTDFHKHPSTGLDRRLNLLIYLNKDWKESYGGHLELWNRDMNQCEKKILPLFNRMVIFNTNDFTYHGHPDPLCSPKEISRRSLALYYFSNGRPSYELKTRRIHQSTNFYTRPGESFARYSLKSLISDWTPPAVMRMLKNNK